MKQSGFLNFEVLADLVTQNVLTPLVIQSASLSASGTEYIEKNPNWLVLKKEIF